MALKAEVSKRGSHAGVVIPIVLAVTVVAALFLSSPPAAYAQADDYRAPRFPGAEVPDLSGMWQALTTANWDIQNHGAAPGPFSELLGAWGVQPAGAGIVVGNEIPYRPEALEQKRKNFESRLTIDPQNMHDTGDPEAKCYIAGVPRAMYQPYPFQIVQREDKVLMAFPFAASSRYIFMADHQEAPVDNWMGWSNGSWDGDTLVVDVTAFNGRTWFDRAGNFASEGLHVVERYTPMSPYHIQYEATIEDPNTFTRPWTVRFPLYRRVEENVEFLDMRCVEFTEQYLYGTLVKESSR